jgi:hypothetical protein
MAEEQAPSENSSAPIVTKDVLEENTASDQPAMVSEEKHATGDESKALAIVETEKKEAAVEPILSKSSEGGSLDRDAILVKVNTEKRLALVKAWEENEKAKAENKYYKSVSTITAWENTKKSSAETRMKRAEEKLEKQKAAYVEKMKNEIAIIHKQAEEKKAMADAKRGEDMLKAEESSAKYNATGQVPKKFFLCFGG